MANKIVEENAKQGNPESEWSIEGDGSANIQGFATQISSNIGQVVDFKIATDATKYRIDIYRLGYYGGDGARKVDSISLNLAAPQIQDHPIVDYTTGLIDAGNWDVSASWQIPTDAVSGLYIAKLVREDGTEGASHIPFIVREDGSTSDIVFQTSDTTWQAYNAWGGASLYEGNVPLDPNDMIAYMPPNCACGTTAIGRATKVSYNRPFVTNSSAWGGTHDFIFGVEHSAIRWLEQNGYDISYISGVDTSRSGAQLMNHDAFLSVGHDEYWSAEQRANVENARDAGVNLAFWSGNEVYWKIRWEDSVDGSGTPYRTMVTYKETWSGAHTDPTDVSTGTWRDPRFRDPGQEPENSLTGTMFTVDSYRLDTITVGYDFSNLRFWRNTEIADLAPGETHSLVKNLLGYEWDSDVENGFRPAGLINMSSSTVDVETYLRDYGTSVGPGTATHSLTMYRAPSGALVFGAGTVFWSWGLDAEHEGAATPTDPNVQQAMVNMFADMGIQPETLQASLVMATKSTDFTAPTSSISSPVFGASFVEGQRVTVTGTAADTDGGVIAGIEVSTDGGLSWFKAQGRENWSYSWIAQASGSYTIMSRAVDDSLNLETPAAGKSVSVSLPDTSSLWTFASKPVNETTLDRDGIEVGVRFQSAIGGLVEGIKFFKGFYNIGTHVVNLWNAAGELLTTATSVGETLSGWQTVLFSTPFQIVAGQTYIASYHSDGYYSSDADYFNTSRSTGPLTVEAGGGVFAYGAGSVFPDRTYQNSNYWVDVVFNAGPNTPPVAVDDGGFVANRNGTLTLSFAALTANDTDTNGDALTVLSVGSAQNGSVVINQQTGTVTFTPTTGYTGAASFTYTVSDGRGGTDSGSVALNVLDGPSGVSLFAETDGPTTGGLHEGRPVELGMNFTVSGSGTITGIRFYKAAGDTGGHTGSLWNSSGQLLGTVNFANESLSGWQVATFATPIQVSQGATYTASYHSTGSYVATPGYFNSAVSKGPLTAPASGTIVQNGLYRYSDGGVAPDASYQASNYWVDVVFNQSTVNSQPIAGNDNNIAVIRNTALAIATSQLLANDSDPDGDALTVTAVGAGTNGTAVLDAASNTITFTPTNGYTGAASFSYTISDGRGGTASATVSMNVTEPGAPDTSIGLFAATAPTNTTVYNDSPVELGMRFTSSVAGTIKGIRFYKAAGETGSHAGTLWTASGQQLATGTFVNETTSGWQTLVFAQPVSIVAGQTYVASYQSNGVYASTSDYFASTVTNGPLSAVGSSNGVYAYGSGAEFPSASYRASNYWVDVLFERSGVNGLPVAANDDGLATSRNTALVIQTSQLLANDSDPDGDALTVTAVGTGTNGTAVFNAASNSITFTPTSGYTGAASFSYTISDGRGGTASATVSMNVTEPAAPDTNIGLFAASAPTNATIYNDSSVELGMRFTSSVAGTIKGIRFYKAAGETGTHSGTLWAANGSRLTTGTFTNETASGWQTLVFAQPVSIAAGQTYVASYHSNGVYASTGNYFTSTQTSGPLSAAGTSNGVYAYGSAASFPNASYNASNYWVDVLFEQASGNSVPVAANDDGLSTSLDTALVIPASQLLANDVDPDGDPLAVTGAANAQNGAVSFNSANNTITFTPTTGFTGPTSFSYSIADGRGGTASANVSLTVQPQQPQGDTVQTLFARSEVPATIYEADNNPVELGMKFRADVAGWITSISFYKGAMNTGPHTGHLWSADGTLLATAQFTNETTSGWQTANLAQDYAIAANTTYVVSYHTNGNYSATENGLSAGLSRGNLSALSAALAGGNGVFNYGPSGSFPENSWNNTNYYVDVGFKPQLAA